MKALNKRLADLEGACRKALRLPLVFIKPGQTQAEALRDAGLPSDAPNGFLQWRAPQ